MSEENVRAVRLIIEGTRAAIAAGDLRSAAQAGLDAGLFDPDVELIPAAEHASGATYRGMNGFIDFMQEWTEDFEDWTTDVDRILEATDTRVVAVVRQRGTGKRSGVPIALEHGLIFDFVQGRVVRGRIFASPGDAAEAAGLTE
jgi:ketosteroid isomerase-like protein